MGDPLGLEAAAGAAVAVMVVGLVSAVAGYVFWALALGAVFRKFGGRPGLAWVPIANLVEMARIARTAVTATAVVGVLTVTLTIAGSVLTVVSPGVGTVLAVAAAPFSLVTWILWVVQAHRLGLERGIPGGMTVVAALVPAIWAAIVGWSRMGTAPEPGPITGAIPVPVLTAEERAALTAEEAPSFPTGETLADDPSTPEVADMDPFQRPGVPPAPAPGWPPAPPAALDDEDGETRIAPPTPIGGTHLPAAGAAGVPPFLGAPTAPPAPPAPPVGAPVSPYLRGGAAAPPPPPPAPPVTGAFPVAPVSGGIPVPPPPPAPAPSTGELPGTPASAPPTGEMPTVVEQPSAFAAASPFAPPAPSPFAPVAEPAVIPVPAAAPVHTPAPAPAPAPAAEAVAAPPLPVGVRAPWESSAQAAPEVPDAALADDDDDDDHTQIAVRRREAWELVTGAGEVYPLTGGVVLLGRPGGRADAGGAARIEIDDATKTISKSHARLVLQDGSWTVEDLGSTNGTALLDTVGAPADLPAHTPTRVTGRMLLGDVELELRRVGG